MKTIITILCMTIVSCTAFTQSEIRQNKTVDTLVIFQQEGISQERLERSYHMTGDSLYFGVAETTVQNRSKTYYFVNVKTKQDLFYFRKFHPKTKIPKNILSKII